MTLLKQNIWNQNQNKKFEHVHKSCIDSFWILQDTSLSLKDGEKLQKNIFSK